MRFTLETIGVIHAPFKEKFGTPRQSGLITDVVSSVELLPPFNRKEALDGLEQFSHIWLSFIFHQNRDKSWTPKVRPPRLGGNKSIGVFASRSPYRPNPLGLSVVELVAIREQGNKLFIDVKGADLVDGTPVVDIKPYIPYSDSIAYAQAGYAKHAPEEKLVVEFTVEAIQQVKQSSNSYPGLEGFIRQVIALDPRPAYTVDEESDKLFGIKLLEFDVKWKVKENLATVISLN